MIRHRRWSPLAAATLALTLALSVLAGQPVSAQGATGAVTIHLQTCNVTGTADTVLLGETSDVPRYLRNCVDGGAGVASVLQIDGQGPDSVTETEAVWNALPVGDHTAVATGMQGTVSFTLDEGGAELWATWARHEPLPAGLGTVVANLVTCDVAGTADSVSLFLDTPPATLTNCREGWAGSAAFLTLGGLAPDTYDENVAIWYDLPYGEYLASAGTMGGDLPITLDGDTATFQASWDKHVTPGGMVQVSVWDCGVATDAASWIGADGDVPAGFDDCTAGRIESREWGLRIDGTTPDWFDANGAYWILDNGTHVATTTSGASYEFTVSGATVNLVAYYGPDGVAVGGTDSTSSAQTSAAAVTALPNTGAGPVSHALPVAVVLIGASLLLMLAGAFVFGTQRSHRAWSRNR